MAIIYYIHATNTNEIYIGSTIRDLKDRIYGHKRVPGITQLILKQAHTFGIIEEYIGDKKGLLWRERYWLERCSKCLSSPNKNKRRKKRLSKIL